MVFNPDTVIYPHTMMVKFLNANVANFAMFWPCRLQNLATFAIIVWGIHDLVELFVKLGHTFYDARITRRSFEKSVIAGSHYYCPYRFMVCREVRTRAKFHVAFFYINKKSTSSHHKVKSLKNWILFVYDIIYDRVRWFLWAFFAAGGLARISQEIEEERKHYQENQNQNEFELWLFKRFFDFEC